jgi:hypothetical protein
VGKILFYTLAKLLDGVKARKRNSKQIIVYGLSILQYEDVTIKSAKAIREHPASRMNAWNKGSANMLVQGTIWYMEGRLLKRQDSQSPEQ